MQRRYLCRRWRPAMPPRHAHSRSGRPATWTERAPLHWSSYRMMRGCFCCCMFVPLLTCFCHFSATDPEFSHCGDVDAAIQDLVYLASKGDKWMWRWLEGSNGHRIQLVWPTNVLILSHCLRLEQESALHRGVPRRTLTTEKSSSSRTSATASSAGTLWKLILPRYFNPVDAHPSWCKLVKTPFGNPNNLTFGNPNNLMPYVQQLVAGSWHVCSHERKDIQRRARWQRGTCSWMHHLDVSWKSRERSRLYTRLVLCSSFLYLLWL